MGKLAFCCPKGKGLVLCRIWICVGYGLAKLSFWQSMEKIEALASGRGHLLMVKHIPHTPPKLMVVEASANSPGVSAL